MRGKRPPDERDEMATTIVLGHDGSDCANHALEHTITVAKLIPGATVLVINAFEFSIGYVPTGIADSPLMMTAEFDAHMERIRSHAEEVVSVAADHIAEAGINVETLVVEGRPIEVLLAAARAREASFVVVGSHGESAVSAVILGSTALKLLHHSELPVLVVPRRS